jgi:AraC family transcriptional regulator, regulatory protein of adaptative response / DNA-3-methyladenine glycosylase II
MELPLPFAAPEMLASLGRDPHSPTEHVEGNIVTRAVWLGGAPALLRLTFDTGKLTVEVDGPRSAEALAQAHRIALRMIGHNQDLRGFLRKVGVLGLPQLVRRRGLRIPLTSDVYEAMTWAIVGQQVGLGFAFALRRRLTELAGTRVSAELIAHPRPQDVARLKYEQLSELQFSARKAEYLIDLSRQIVSGELDIDNMAATPYPQLEQRLLGLRGLGPWAVNYILLRGLGAADCVPLGDTGLTSGLQRVLKLQTRPGPAETLALMEQFRPYRSLATFHIWQSLKEPLQ